MSWKHALPNALIPVVTLSGVIAGLLGGAVIVEQIFALPGLGRLISTRSASATTRWCRAPCCSSPSTSLVVNLLVDLAYAALDPRIRLGK